MSRELLHLNIKLAIRSFFFWAVFIFTASAYMVMTYGIAEKHRHLLYFLHFQKWVYLEIVLYILLFLLGVYFAQKKSVLEDICFVSKENTHTTRLLSLVLCSMLFLCIPIAQFIIGHFRDSTTFAYFLLAVFYMIIRWVPLITVAVTTGYFAGYCIPSKIAYLFSVPFTIAETFLNEDFLYDVFGINPGSAVQHLFSLSMEYYNNGDNIFGGPRIDTLLLTKSLFGLAVCCAVICALRIICLKRFRPGSTIGVTLSLVCALCLGIVYCGLHPKTYSLEDKLYSHSERQPYKISSCIGTVDLGEWLNYDLTLKLDALKDANKVNIRLDQCMTILSFTVDGDAVAPKRAGDILQLELTPGDHTIGIRARGRVCYARDNVAVTIYTTWTSCALPSKFAFFPIIDSNESPIYYDLVVHSANTLVTNVDYTKEGDTYHLNGQSKTLCLYSGWFKSMEWHGLTIFFSPLEQFKDVETHLENYFGSTKKSIKAYINGLTYEFIRGPVKLRDKIILYAGAYEISGAIDFDDYLLITYA